MRELYYAPSAKAIAKLYFGHVDGIVIDERDSDLVGDIESIRLHACAADVLMKDKQDQASLAKAALEFALHLGGASRAHPS